MTPADYTAALAATAGRELGALGVELGTAFALNLPGRGITTPLRLAYFLGETCQETEGYRYLVELGGPTYCAQYDAGTAKGRELGNTEPGDGFRFRGRGLIQITGRANYATFGLALRLDLVGNPDLAAQAPNATAIAALFWAGHGLNALADADDLAALTRRINGGETGLAEREACLARAKRALGVTGH